MQVHDKFRQVMIVDDERLVRVGLMQTVDWKRWNLQVVADAPNGRAAWELFCRHRPELVITDIVMPGMDGIQLTEKIKQKAPETKVLFLSCHRDFAYAQQGMALGASGYVLKTAMGEDELDPYLDKMMEEWRQQESDVIAHAHANQDGENPWIRYSGSLVTAPATLREKLERSLTDRTQESVELILVSGPEEAAGDELVAVAVCTCGDDDRLYVVPVSAREQWQRHLVKQKAAIPSLNWSHGGPVQGIDAMMRLAEQMVLARQLERRYGVRSETISQPVMDAIRYIEAHLHEPLQSAMLAEIAGLSRSHFCTVFKKETGIGFLHYLHQRRLERACKLLRSTEWKVGLIGEKVGMPDDKHFSKWFKKHTGQTPTGYRHQTN